MVLQVARDRRYADATSKALDELRERDLEEVARLSGGEPLPDGRLSIRILNRSALVDRGSGEIVWSDGAGLEEDLKVLLLHYLLKAEGKLDGRWASYREFEGGALYYSVFHGRAIAPLVSAFGERPDLLTLAASSLGGVPVKRGDVSFDFWFFPYLLLNITLWEGDEEVPASANILFDSSTGRILGAEDLAHLAADLVSILVKSIK